MNDEGTEHGHAPISHQELRTKALESLIVEKGLTSSDASDTIEQAF